MYPFPHVSKFKVNAQHNGFRNKKERQKNFHKARRTGIDTDTVLMYDIPSQKFESRPIAKVYGVVNMYRDQRNIDNVDHLEQSLARLEADAARTIRKIHTAVEFRKPEIQMKRRELEAIRKFTYLMHYRRTSLVSTYFDENDPDNRPLRDYFKAFYKKHKLQNKDDVWLYGLKYILDTPHHQIVGTGEAIEARYGGPQKLLEMLMTRVDPDIENFQAVDYTAMANAYFLGIWEAAGGEEFVMGSNSFGLWEGVVGGCPAIHRLFVVSPRIALILRNTLLPQIEVIDDMKIKSNIPIKSNLIDVPMTIANSTYANFPHLPCSNDQEQQVAAQALWKYRQTPAAQEDVFTFKPTKLTWEQTRAVNCVLLLHLPDNGNLTFASPTAMKKTTQYHLQSTIPYAGESKYSLRSLLGILSMNDSLASSTSPTPVLPLARSGIDIVLHSIVSGAIEFHSIYDRAYRVYHLATDDVTKYNQSSSEIHQITARAILRMKEILPPLPHAYRHSYIPFFCRDIVKELPKEESELFFALVGHQVDVLKVGSANDDILSQIKYEAAIIGFTHWLAENRFMFLVNLLSFWVKVVL